jgi:hypothetical protein
MHGLCTLQDMMPVPHCIVAFEGRLLPTSWRLVGPGCGCGRQDFCGRLAITAHTLVGSSCARSDAFKEMYGGPMSSGDTEGHAELAREAAGAVHRSGRL